METSGEIKEEKVCALNQGKPRAVFPLQVESRKSSCLWDSGATISLVSMDVLEKLGLKHKIKTLGHTHNISGLSGRVSSSAGAELFVSFQDGVLRKVNCVVCHNVPYGIILGLPFMTEHKISFKPDGKGGFRLENDANKRIACTIKQAAIRDDGLVLDEALVGEAQKAPEKGDGLDPIMSGMFKYKLKSTDLDEVLVTLLGEGKYYVDATEMTPEQREFIPEQHSSFVVTDEETGMTFPEAEAWELNEDQKKRFNDLLEEFSDIFASSASDVGKANFEPVKIKLVKKEPVALRNYRTPLQYRDWLKQELHHLLEAKIIEQSESPYNAPLLVVPKKMDVNQDDTGQDDTASKGNRLVIDYRQVNKVLEEANFPIPRIQDLLLDLSGKKVLSCMDIRHAFYTIELDPQSRKITAFSCEFGKYQFRFLPQGLKISPAIFQQRISTVLAPYEHSNPYMDDIFTASLEVELHFPDLREVFLAMRRSNFKLKKGKCLFFMKSVPCVGHMVSEDGVSVAPDKLRDVLKLQPPKTVGEVRALLGFANFLRDHVHYFADIVAPIQDLVSKGGGKSKKNIEEFWDEKCAVSFREIKKALLDNKVLAFPDNKKPYELYTDASGRHMAGVLMQEGRPIGYFARSFKNTEINWGALVKEAHAVYRAVQFFSVFITAAKVTLRCDHKPLERFLVADTKNQMVNRWSLNMQQYDIDFKWVATDKNISDCLSRLIDAGVYQPHEKVEEDFNVYPKNQLDVMVVEPEVVKGVDLPKPILGSDMRELQRCDPYCRRVLEQLCSDKNMEKQFTVLDSDKLLYRIVYVKDLPKHLALVIPPKLGLSVIVNVHQHLMHPGENKTLDSIRTRVYWKNMAKEVKAFIKGCRICQIKNLKENLYPLKHDKPSIKPLVRLAADFAGSGYKESARGNKAVFTAICTHSQYPFAVPTPDKTSASAIQALHLILADAVNCKELLTDNGPEFTSEEFQSFLRNCGIKHCRTAPYSPMSNGALERWHRFLNQVVRMSDGVREGNSWEDSVVAAYKAYRIMPHTSSGESPYFLVRGEDPNLVLDNWMPTLTRSTGRMLMDLEVRKQLQIAFGIARKNICLSRLRNKGKTTESPAEYNVGDLVTIKNNNAGKGERLWKVGYRVTEKHGDRTVSLEDIKSGKKLKANVRNIRLTEPLSYLLENSTFDVYPGKTKLYLPASEIPDLKWPAPETVTPETDSDIQSKLLEVVRNRTFDTFQQKPPHPVPPSPQNIERRQAGLERRNKRLLDPKFRPQDPNYVTRSGRVSQPPSRLNTHVFVSENLNECERKDAMVVMCLVSKDVKG